MNELLTHFLREYGVWPVLGLMAASAVAGWVAKLAYERISQRQLFDHRLRLEKEYGTYCQLWDKLFEFRRAAGAFAVIGDSRAEEPAYESFARAFNAYQAVVRRGEPFIHPTVYAPAREAVSIGHRMDGQIKKIARLHKRRDGRLTDAADEAVADEQLAAEEQVESEREALERLFETTRDVIRKRIMIGV